MSDKGSVTVHADLCKGCGLCITACTPKVLRFSHERNHRGYLPVEYVGAGCSGCGLCFYACPEPDALTIYKRAA